LQWKCPIFEWRRRRRRRRLMQCGGGDGARVGSLSPM